MYGMVHAMIGIMYNVNNPGPSFLNFCPNIVSIANSIGSSSIHTTDLQTLRQWPKSYSYDFNATLTLEATSTTAIPRHHILDTWESQSYAALH